MAVDMFLKLDGIEGESTSQKHKGEIELLSFGWGLSQQTSSGGAGAGKLQISEFSITKEVDASSPRLMEACCRGEHIKEGTLTVVAKGGGKQQDYYIIKLTDVLVTGYQTGGNNNTPMDQVALNFASVDVSVLDRRTGNPTSVQCDFQKLGNTLGGNHHNHND